VEQARQDGASADWVALELRMDRAHQIFAQMALGAVPNLGLVCADACHIFPGRVRPRSVDCLCINHPQPPEWSGGVDDSQGEHLLRPPFLRALHASLRPGGTLAIVTDNLRYGRSLAASLAGLDGCAFEAVAVEQPRLAPGEQNASVPLLEGLPPASCGYTVRASSYFDRLWANGNRKRRFFVAVARAGE
jgi:tRNA G46 methylase TrmB